MSNLLHCFNCIIKATNVDFTTIRTTTFSIVINGSEARIFTTWRKEGSLNSRPPRPAKFIMKKVGSYALQDPSQYLKFRNYVRNIITYGKELLV